MMKKTFLSYAFLLAVAWLALASSAPAQSTYTWNSTSSGNWTTSNSTGWNAGGLYPNAAGDTAIFSQNLTVAATITMNATGTVGNLTLADTNGATAYAWTIAGPSTLTFDSVSGPATLTANGGAGMYNGNAMTISAPVALNDDLSINVQDMGTALTMSGLVNAGNKAISLTGPGGFTLSNSTTNLAGVTVGGTQRAITISGNNTLSGNYALGLRNIAEFTQSGALAITGGSVTINANNLGRALISGAITGATDLTINGTGSLNKAPEANNIFNSLLEKSLVRMTGNNSFSGNTTLSASALYLDYSTNNNTSKIGSTGVLTLNNAVLSINGSTTANTTQTVGSTSITARSGNQITVNKGAGAFTTSLNLGNMTVGAEAWVNFRTIATAGTSSILVGNSNANGILGAWATIGTPGIPSGDNLTWATVSGGAVVGATIANTALTAMAAAGGGNATVNFSYSPTASGTNNKGILAAITGNVTANSFKLIGPSSYFNTLNTGTSTFTLTSGGMILTTSAGTAPTSMLPYSVWSQIGSDGATTSLRVTGTGLIASSDPATIPLYIYTNRPTWLDNPVVGSSSGRLVKGGDGTLFLSANSTMSGITVSGGEVALTGSAATMSLPGNISLNNGGQLMTNGTFTRAIGSGDGKVSFGAGGGGFAATAGGLTLNLTGSGTAGAITTGDVGNNLVVTNTHSATGVTTLASNIDTTGEMILSVARSEGVAGGSGIVGTNSNAGSAYAVVTGATSGSGALTLLGPTSASNGVVTTVGGGLIYLKGALGHTGGLSVAGTTLFLGKENPAYLSGVNLNLSGGATLAASGANSYTVGSGAGQLSFAGTGATPSYMANDAGGFSAVGGANTVTLNGAVNFDSPSSNPYAFSAINLGSTLSTHQVTLTNDLISTTSTIYIAVSGPQAAHLTGNISSTTGGLQIGGSNTFGTLVLSGTGSTYGGGLGVDPGFFVKIGNVAAFGNATATKTITVAGTASLDMAGASDTSTTHSWTLSAGSAITPVGNIINSNTSTTSTISGNVSVSDFGGGNNLMVGGPGNITFGGTFRNLATSNASLLNFGGSGTYTFMNDFDNQGITNARNTIIYGSTVVFDNSVFNTDGVTNSRTITNVSGSYLQSYSGTFRLLGNTSANTTQSVGNNGAQFNYAANTIQVLSGTGAGQTTVLNMGNLTRSNAGTANFIVTSQGSGNATVTTTLANGTGNILGSWLTYNGTSYAANDGSNNIIAFAGYNTANFTSTTVSDINAGFTTSGAATSVGMRFNDSSATTLTLSGTLAGASNSLGVLVTDNVNAPITITGSNITATDLVVHQYETSGALTIASQLSGASVRVVATGPGTVVVGNGANNGNAAATIGQGVLEVSAANALGSSTASTNINISGNGTLRYTGSADYQRGGGTGGTGQVNLLGNGNIENNGTGKLTLGSTQGFAIISSYSPNLTIGGSGSIDVAGIQLGTAFIYEGYSKLTKTGSGTVTLTEESILQGGLDINAGTFALSGNGSIQAWTPVNINGGTFDNKTALTKQGGNIDLTSGNITSTGGGAFTIQALNAAIASGNSTVSANIQGELAAVSKTGAGTLTLNGSNTYGQGTYVSVGTLLVNNTSGSATGAGAVSVSSGATLGGNGTISGPVSAGGTLAAGNGIGTLTLGSLTLTSSGILDNELGRNGAAPVSDLVAINGSVSLASGSDLKLTLYGGLSAPQAGDVFFLIGNDGADSITGVFTKLNGAATTLNEGSQFSWNSQSWAITYTADMGTSSFTGGNDLALMVVPEPSTWILIVLGGIFCLLWRAGAASDRKRLSGVTGATSQ